MSYMHLEDKTPRARKPYGCYLCGRTIPVGERYVYRTGVDAGTLTVTRMHAACEALTEDWGEDDWTSHDVEEFRRKELGESPATGGK